MCVADVLDIPILTHDISKSPTGLTLTSTRDECVRHALTVGVCPLCRKRLTFKTRNISCSCGFKVGREEIAWHEHAGRATRVESDSESLLP